MTSETVHVEKNTISGLWEVRHNARRVVNTKHKSHAIKDAHTIANYLQHAGVEVILHFDLRG